MNYKDASLIYWIWLSQIKNVGPVTAKELLKVFYAPEKIYYANHEEILKVNNVGEKRD